MNRTIEALLAADLVAAGTVDVSYPAGFNENHFSPVGHKIAIKNGGLLLQGRDFAVTLTRTYATITLAAGQDTIPAGSVIFVELALKGNRSPLDPTTLGAAGNRVSRREVFEVNFGAPIAADADGVSVSASITAAAGATIGGALASDGVATFDVPRNVTITSAGNDSAKTFTVTGTDEYGAIVVENITGANAGAAAGKKAFKTVTAVGIDSNSAGAVTIGCGDVLGFPVFLLNSVNVLYDTEDGAAVTDGTYVAGVLTKPSATTGDVRGTYDPNSACDGAKNFSVVLLLDNPEFKGVPQYAG